MPHPHCPSCRQSRWMYHWDVPLMGWFTSLTGRLPYECLSCGWRGWWLPPELRSGGSRLRVFIAGAAGLVRSTATGAGRVFLPIGSSVARSLTGYRKSIGERVARLPRPARPRAFGGAALVGLLVGLIAALIVLSTRAKELPDQATIETPPQTVAEMPPAAASEPAVQTRPAVMAAAQPATSTQPRPMPQPVPVALTTPARAGAARVAASPTPTTGSAQRAIARSEPRPQDAPAVKIAGYSGDLEIDSDPDGARVFVDGAAVGFTPLELKDLPVGSRVVRVEANGYETWTTAARVVANQRARVSAVLHRSQR